MTRVNGWKVIVDKFKASFQTGKLKLYLVGDINLMKYFLESIVIYYMSVFKVHIIVINHLKCIRNIFLWDDMREKNLMLIKWKKVMARSRLGVGSLYTFNRALVHK